MFSDSAETTPSASQENPVAASPKADRPSTRGRWGGRRAARLSEEAEVPRPGESTLAIDPSAVQGGAVEPVADHEQRDPGWHGHWIWPLGLAVAGISSAATLLLRGCWHSHMSWPMDVDHEFSYQVCTSCGIKRLYDEKTFHGYGPYGYDVNDLIARERAYRAKRLQQEEERRARREARAKLGDDRFIG